MVPGSSFRPIRPCVARSYDDVVTDLLRSLRAEPRPPGAPRRVWRDWVVVGLFVTGALLETALRPDVPWRWGSLASALVLVPALLWRRTRPLAMVVLTFGVTLVFTVAYDLAVGGPPAGLYASSVLLLMPYAVMRWGSGREVIAGAAIVLASSTVLIIVDDPTVSDAIGGYTVIALTLMVGLVARYQRRLLEREFEQVRSAEREHLARDLHDTVAHHVSAIAIRAQAGLATAATDPAAATDALRVIEGEASRTLAEMRAMIGVLRRHDPAALAPTPGFAEVRRLADATADGPPVTVTVAGAGDASAVPEAVATAVYRLAQESVTNARRHASGATRIDITVTVDDGEVRLRVQDDGRATTGRTEGAAGFGIQGMIERADLLGGVCTVGPDAGGGWTVTATLPCGMVRA